MEKRALIAIALSVAVLLAWHLWVGGPPPPPASTTPAPEAPGAAAPAPTAESPAPKAAVAPRAAVPAAPGAEVIAPLYRASFAVDGSVTAWTIEYRGAKRVVVGGALRPLSVGVERPGQGIELVTLGEPLDGANLPPLAVDGQQ